MHQVGFGLEGQEMNINIEYPSSFQDQDQHQDQQSCQEFGKLGQEPVHERMPNTLTTSTAPADEKTYSRNDRDMDKVKVKREKQDSKKRFKKADQKQGYERKNMSSSVLGLSTTSLSSMPSSMPSSKMKNTTGSGTKKKYRPGCRPTKLENTKSNYDQQLISAPSLETLTTPLVWQNVNGTIQVDFNRPPHVDERFVFVNYCMVLISNNIKLLSTCLTQAAQVLTDQMPVFFLRDTIEIRGRELDEDSGENFIFQISINPLEHYFSCRPLAFLFDRRNADFMKIIHGTESGENSVVWKANSINALEVQLFNDVNNMSENYEVHVTWNENPPVEAIPLQCDALHCDVQLKQLAQACAKLNRSDLPNPSMTFRFWDDALELFSENPKNNHVIGLTEYRAKRKVLQLSYNLSLNLLKKLCSWMKKAKGHTPFIGISVDSNPSSAVRFSQRLTDSVTLIWWRGIL